jgi:acyl dehydratase
MNLLKTKLKNLKLQDKFKIGDYVELQHSFSSEDVEIFSKISTDFNPIHLDEEVASKGIFGKKIVHGILVSSLFSGLIANKLPGPGSVYLHQELKFLKPVFHDEKIIARIEIIEIRKDKPIFNLNTSVIKKTGEYVIKGYAIIKLP